MYHHVDKSRIHVALAKHWAESSILMHSLAEARGIRYLHIIQPNQYYETGRVLTKEELKHAIDVQHPYREGVMKGYPELLGLIPYLLHNGVDIVDATKVFDTAERTIYIDSCCHPGPYGYELVGGFIAELLIERLQ